jgi:hypothetical protein
VQFSHAFSGEGYDFYSVSPEYFGYTLVHIPFVKRRISVLDFI